MSHRRDDGVFQSGDVEFPGRRVVGDRDYRPRDDLTRGVVRHVPTAVGVDHDGVEGLRRDQEVFVERPDPSGVGRRVFEDQDVVVARLEQRSLEVVRLGEADPTEMATAQHLALAFDVETREQLADPFEVVRRRDRFAYAVIEGQSQHQSAPDPHGGDAVSVTTTGTSRTAPTESTATWGWMMIGSAHSQCGHSARRAP